jgi:vacuolar-type H+-ATPase subunit H
MATKNGKIKEIWGRQFNIVKNGLDEAEVFSFLSRIVDQNQELASKLEHVDSLRKLAEKAVIEASRHAERIKTEADQIANDKANEIIAQAQQQGRSEVDRIISESESSALERISAAEQLAQDLLAQAEEKANELTSEILADAQEKAKKLGEEIIARSENRARSQTEVIIAEAEQKAENEVQERISSAEQKSKAIIESAEKETQAIKEPVDGEASAILSNAMEMMEAAEQKAREILASAEEQADSMKSLAEQEANKLITEIKHKAEFSAQAKIAKAEEEGQRIINESKKLAELDAERHRQVAGDIPRAVKDQDVDLKEQIDRLYDLVLASAANGVERPTVPEPEEDQEDPSLYHGPIEIDFPPPVDSGRVLKIHKYLAKTPKCRVVDVEGSSRGGIRIRIVLGSRLPLMEMLESLPEVERITDGVRPASGSPHPSKKGQGPTVRKVIIATKTNR